ncbi:hypothetical protein [Nocardioides sp. T2.26MG-1]|uniref:hypothetical protein n=1 Tax=Nocardioides sp. T2.26MG-1 TaxID=3041166 RepID=UPI002477855A|nr:hypothetical protein [Nocardioides sp. T2.26MG-1]CAI9412695.1 hypothetical protein HIDPHFAB_01837 [Nocardioides sp. T2.26MG-1]
MSTGLASLAGAIATLLFVTSTLPMLTKAVRTRDLTSYSGSNLAVANVGNIAQTLYLTTVPSIPIWALHLFNTLASASMLALWIRHRPVEGPRRAAGRAASTPSAPTGRVCGTIHRASNTEADLARVRSCPPG